MTSPSTFLPVLPGQWLGMLGGGHLGRMFCHAAQRLGYKVAVLDPAEQCPAGVAADRHIRARYDDESGLAQLANLDRKSFGKGQRVAVRLDLGGRRLIKKKKNIRN